MSAILFAAFSQGLVGIFHCPVMCGPFASIAETNSGNTGRIFYHTGRLTGYATVGGLSGLLGDWLNTAFLSQTAALVGGVVILVYAASIVFQFQLPGFLHTPARLLTPMIRQKGTVGAITLGLCSSLLPCGMLFPAYALAISSGSLTTGVAVMVLFCIGTMPSFVALAILRNPLQRIPINATLRRIAPAILLIISLGLIAYRTYNAEVVCAHPQ